MTSARNTDTIAQAAIGAVFGDLSSASTHGVTMGVYACGEGRENRSRQDVEEHSAAGLGTVGAVFSGI